MNQVLFSYVTDATILVLLCMLCLVAVKKGLEILLEIQTLTKKITKKVHDDKPEKKQEENT